jgi:hypothetical protein
MASLTPLTVAIHLQDDPHACGRACAQMIARFLTGKLTQQGGMSTAVAPLPPWTTTPDQLADLLNRNNPAGSPEYAVHTAADADTAMNIAISSVDHQPGKRWPVAALIGGGRHWEVVHGFTTGKKGGLTVHARNPLPDRDSVEPQPLSAHADTDQCGFFNDKGGGDLEDEAVAWDTWKQHYFLQCLFAPPRWCGKFIIVAPRAESIRITRRSIPDLKHPGQPIADARAASDVSLARLDDSGLLEIPYWNAALADMPPGIAYRSARIEYLEHPGAYYLVANTKPNEGGALTAIDEETGHLLWAKLNPPLNVLKSLFAPRPDGRLVWVACRESFYSPMIPFVEVLMNGSAHYVRLFDRKSFATLNRGDDYYA